MKVREIGQINEALLVLRHFIDLSARLLPFLDELQRKRNLSPTEHISKVKIIDVYQNYSFDTKTSKVLLNSDVLAMIKDSFSAMHSPSIDSRATKSRRALRKFLSEHKRLQEDWFQIDAN